jgi:hypothetical protein
MKAAASYKTSLRAIFTPALDRFTMGKFNGNHFDLFVSFNRNGDLVTVRQAWVRDAAGTFANHEEKDYSIKTLLRGLKECAEECRLSFECTDDLPEGFSMASPV